MQLTKEIKVNANEYLNSTLKHANDACKKNVNELKVYNGGISHLTPFLIHQVHMKCEVKIIL